MPESIVCTLPHDVAKYHWYKRRVATVDPGYAAKLTVRTEERRTWVVYTGETALDACGNLRRILQHEINAAIEVAS